MPDSPSENTTVTAGQDSQVASQAEKTAVSPAATEGAQAASPPADQGSNKESFADAIKRAVNNSQEQSPGSETGNTGEETSPNGAPEGETVDDKPLTKDDLPHLHSKTRKRVGKLLADNESLRKEADSHREPADLYRGQMDFLKANGLDVKDANNAFDIMANIQNNPARALEQLEPIVAALRQKTGAEMPEDLREKVQQGYLSEADARELSRLKALEANGKERTEQETQRIQNQARIDAQNNSKAIEQGVVEWEKAWQASDPDYLKVRDEVLNAVELELARRQRAGTLPKGKADAIALVEKVKKDTVAKIASYRPQPKPIQHVTGHALHAAKPSKPASLAAAIQQRVNSGG